MKPARSPRIQALLASLLIAYVRLITVTLRWRLVGFERAEAALENGSGVIALFWHGRIAQALACRPFLRGRDAAVLISQSRDGAFIAEVARRLGVLPIRGSTGREGEAMAKGGVGAFREAVRRLVAGGVLLITPDGPRGPARVLPLGPVQMARASHQDAFALGLAARPALKLGSWDQAHLPLPFSRATLCVVGPLRAPVLAAEGEVQTLRAQWQAALDAAQSRAESTLTPRPLALTLYAGLTALAGPALRLWLRRRLSLGKEHSGRWREKLGASNSARPHGPVLWLHGVSAGESLSLVALAERVRRVRPDITLLFTTATVSSAALIAPRLPAGAVHQFSPLDTPGAVARFLDFWRPHAGVLAESELWPNLILGARARGVRLGLISARLSARSARGWRRAPASARALFAAFDLILARDAEAEQTLKTFGARIDGLADLKFGASPLPASAEALARLGAALQGRPLLFAASTHPGEEALLIRAFRDAQAQEACLAIAPRHPERGAEIATLAAAQGLSVSRRSLGESPAGRQVYVVDTVGELGLFYRLARLSVIGGSLIPNGPGGHNPLEPARLGAPFVSGAHVAAWPIYQSLAAADACRMAKPEDLAEIWSEALTEPGDLSDRAARASAFVAAADSRAEAAIAPVLALIA